ncbi:ACP phosphodiesterase [Ascidiimonas sp. W6]|uniref:acyl carrier protein phosphodiesterase n=1 Tax=Ascidiimonas meishanensis TaxID=3128903 RepID=UPI0030EE51F4
MNFLAHIYLSGDQDLVKIGNFAADSVRGKKYMNYPPEMQKGILLHRHIDTFTDAHPTVRKSTKKLHANYSHYSGVIVDIFYDHFLAHNWKNYSPVPLDIYVSNFYLLLQKHFDILPQRIQKMIPFMIKDNWLLSYATIEGISRILYQMNNRTKNISRMNFAVIELEKYYQEFESEFTSFFEELIEYSQDKLKSL